MSLAKAKNVVSKTVPMQDEDIATFLAIFTKSNLTVDLF